MKSKSIVGSDSQIFFSKICHDLANFLYIQLSRSEGVAIMNGMYCIHNISHLTSKCLLQEPTPNFSM